MCRRFTKNQYLMTLERIEKSEFCAYFFVYPSNRRRIGAKSNAGFEYFPMLSIDFSKKMKMPDRAEKFFSNSVDLAIWVSILAAQIFLQPKKSILSNTASNYFWRRWIVKGWKWVTPQTACRSVPPARSSMRSKSKMPGNPESAHIHIYVYINISQLLCLCFSKRKIFCKKFPTTSRMLAQSVGNFCGKTLASEHLASREDVLKNNKDFQ